MSYRSVRATAATDDSRSLCWVIAAAVGLTNFATVAVAQIPPPSAPPTDPTTGAVVAAVTVVLAVFFGLLMFVMYRERRARRLRRHSAPL